jgi:serine/threonine-protein phosphatase PP1 catalytic subunit
LSAFGFRQKKTCFLSRLVSFSDFDADTSWPVKSQLTMSVKERMENLLESLFDMSHKTSWNWCDIQVEDLEAVLQAAKAPLLADGPLVHVTAPAHVYGDTHGEFRDLLQMVMVMGYPPDSAVPMLFLGDMVDRGPDSIDLVVFLLILKISYPDRVFMIRGNHEMRDVNRQYGLYDECRRRFGRRDGDRIWNLMNEVFDCLSVAAVVGGRVFCIHGGITPRLQELSQIRKIRLPLVMPPADSADEDAALVGELVWADPSRAVDGYGRGERGVIFGLGAVNTLLDRFDFDLLVRGHQSCDGWNFPLGDPVCVTVFSARDYGTQSNRAAILDIDAQLTCGMVRFGSGHVRRVDEEKCESSVKASPPVLARDEEVSR